MHAREVSVDRTFVLRLETGRDWRAQLEAFAAEHDIEAGWFTGLGAVQGAELYYYDQPSQTYAPFEVDEPMEVAACVGNVSLLDGEVFAHTHAVLSDPTGRTVSGHLNRAETYAGEVYLQAFEDPIERSHDERTDLDLWRFDDGN